MAGRGVEDGLEDHTLHKKKKNIMNIMLSIFLFAMCSTGSSRQNYVIYFVVLPAKS